MCLMELMLAVHMLCRVAAVGYQAQVCSLAKQFRLHILEWKASAETSSVLGVAGDTLQSARLAVAARTRHLPAG